MQIYFKEISKNVLAAEKLIAFGLDTVFLAVELIYPSWLKCLISSAVLFVSSRPLIKRVVRRARHPLWHIRQRQYMRSLRTMCFTYSFPWYRSNIQPPFAVSSISAAYIKPTYERDWTRQRERERINYRLIVSLGFGNTPWFIRFCWK